MTKTIQIDELKQKIDNLHKTVTNIKAGYGDNPPDEDTIKEVSELENSLDYLNNFYFHIKLATYREFKESLN
jgi:hypothetical protein